MPKPLPIPVLTELELRFVEEYCVDLQPKAAAKRAGKADSTASQWGNEMLRRPEIKYAIDIRRDEMNKQSIVSAEWVRTKFKEIVERCTQATPVMIRGADGKMVESGEWKFDSNGANKALEHLGKHIGMFTDKTTITIETELKQLTDTQLESRRRALIEEHATLDLSQNAEGIYEVAAPTEVKETTDGDKPERTDADKWPDDDGGGNAQLDVIESTAVDITLGGQPGRGK